jgi:DNA-binding NarL/FixJ family response regulator
MEPRRRLLIVEDQRLVSDALVGLLGVAPGLVVVGVAYTIRDARRLLGDLEPDIMVADLLLEDGSAIELLRLVRRERLGTRVVVLTALRDRFAATEALSAGALGYVLKSQPARELFEAIEIVSMGRRYVSPRIEPLLALRSAEPGDPVGLERLSRRELEILRLIAGGRTSSEIARGLSISTKTIDTHRSNMYRKLALRNTVDLMRFATVHGIGIAGMPDEPDSQAD